MSGYNNSISNIKEKKFSYMVELGDNSTYSIQGVGSTLFQLSSGDVLHVKDILYVPILNNLPTFSSGY